MTTMIEKVAKAIAVADVNITAKTYPEMPMETMAELLQKVVDKGHYQAMARAAIEAMREPTEDMQTGALAKVGHEVDWVGGLMGSIYGAGVQVLADGYSAMIDAALKEEDRE